MKKILVPTILVTLVLGCSSHKPSFKGTPFEKHITLEGVGFTQSRLDSLTNFLKINLEITGIIIIKDGKILYE